MIIPLLKLLLYTFAFYYIINAVIELSLTQVIAFSGLFGAAIGFGLKDLFADIVGGVVIIFEKPYQIGDKVTIGDKYGEVKIIGIRSTRIQTPADELVSVPNFTIFSQPVTSGNAGDLAMMIVIDLFIHPDSDADKAMKILKEAIVTSKYVIISKKYTYHGASRGLPLLQACPCKRICHRPPARVRVQVRSHPENMGGVYQGRDPAAVVCSPVNGCERTVPAKDTVILFYPGMGLCLT